MHRGCQLLSRRNCWLLRYGNCGASTPDCKSREAARERASSRGSFASARSHARSISAPSCAWIASLATALMLSPLAACHRHGDSGIAGSAQGARLHPPTRKRAGSPPRRGYESRDPRVSSTVDTSGLSPTRKSRSDCPSWLGAAAASAWPLQAWSSHVALLRRHPPHAGRAPGRTKAFVHNRSRRPATASATLRCAAGLLPGVSGPLES